MAYGPTPQELDLVADIGALAYIDEQLNPQDIPENPDLLDLELGLNPSSNLTDLYRIQFLRAAYSNRQLQEVLVDFWNNHFNTRVHTIRSSLTFSRLTWSSGL